MSKSVIIINRYPLETSFHLKTKFDGQINGFKDLGLNTKLLCFDKHSFYLNIEGKKERIGTAHTKLPSYFHLFYYIDAGLCMGKYLKKSKDEYMIYYRSGPCFRALYKMAKIAHEKGIKFVCELPSYYGDGKGEKQLSVFRTLYTIIWEYWQKKMDKYITLYALIGAKNESGVYRGRPSVDISNAIDIDNIPLREPESDNKIHILALGTMTEYQGFDRLIKAAEQYKGQLDYTIHFVGGNAGGYLEKWKELASDLGVEKTCIFHGPLYGADLNLMFNKCDIGVSSLGAYRIGMKSLSSLKLLEYTARGLPFVYSADDDLIDNQKQCEKFAYKISNNDSIPDMDKILQFALSTKKDIELPVIEREYAKEKMQWSEQFGKMMQKLNEL